MMDMCELAPYWALMTEGQQRGLLGFVRETCRASEGGHERFLSVSECMGATRLSRSTINRAINSGELRSVAPRGTRRVRLVRESDLDDWMGGDR